MTEKVSFFKKNFWDLWLMKIFRNLASVKYQWLMILYVPVIWGMFHMKPVVPPAIATEPWISASLGLGFLGGGFVTLATSRIISRTKLTENGNGDLDTDR